MNIEPIKKNLKSIFESNQNVIFAFLFGSMAKNKLRYGSDIDIAIYFKNSPTLYEIGDLALIIEEKVNIKADLIELNNLYKINPVLSYAVISEGILIINNDNNKFNEFKKSAVMYYLDFKPTNDLINAGFNNRVLNNGYAVFEK